MALVTAPLGAPQVLAPTLMPAQAALALMPEMPVDPAAPRVKELGPNCELRIMLDDDKVARVKLLALAQQQQQSRSGQPVMTSAERFGAELVPGHEYQLHGGTRTAIYTWHGCRIQVSGPTKQEYEAPNVCMKEYLSCAAVIEQRRIRAIELDLPAPRVLVCGSAFSGKSSLCQMLCNYALRRERNPIYVDLDPRYSNIRQLQGLPACVTAMPVEHPADEEPQRRMSYFFGHVDWSDNQLLYERCVSLLSRVVSAKLAHNTSTEGARVATSGIIVNAPFQPTPEIIKKIVEMFEIDVVLVLDDESLHAAISKIYANSGAAGDADAKRRRVQGASKVEVVPLPKAGGVVQMPPKRIRMLRALGVREYFYGVMRDFHPYSILIDLDDVQLVQMERKELLPGMLPVGHEAQTTVDFSVRPFTGNPMQLENVLLGVVRASSASEVIYAPLCGLVLVTKVEEHALQLLCPAPPPLAGQFLMVGDFKNLKFLDI